MDEYLVPHDQMVLDLLLEFQYGNWCIPMQTETCNIWNCIQLAIKILWIATWLTICPEYLLGPCLVPTKIQKVFKIPHYIKSCGTYMKH